MFKKNDDRKLQYDLLPPKALAKVVAGLTYGATKYAKDNWKQCDDLSRYVNACYRHIEAYRAGETIDKESKCEHLAHAICNLMFIMELDNVKKEN